MTQGPWSVEADPEFVVLGGEFTRVDGRNQQGLVRFTLPGRQNVLRGPEESVAMAPTVAGQAGGAARLTWTANWDRDELNLSYEVRRDGVVVGRVRRRSTFWDRPTLAFTDRGLSRGRTYAYAIRASRRVDPATKPDGQVHLRRMIRPPAPD